jgi:zinc/manganese transport system substrate-binding protein
MKTTIEILTALVAVLTLGVSPAGAAGKLRVAASTTDLGSIAAAVGGEWVEVFAVSRPHSDVHRVEVLPSYMVKVSRASVYLKVGLGLDQWADGIIDGSRNTRIHVVDCSVGITPLEKPTQVNASMGDVHPFGNPHYWLDPRNGGIVAEHVAEELGRLDPTHAAQFRSRAKELAEDLEDSYKRGREIVGAMPVKTIFTYHASWVHLASAFGLEIAGTVEPVPGIPPTGKHLQQLVEIARARKVALLLQEPYFSDDAGRFLTRQAGIRVVKASPSCDDATAGSYRTHIEKVLEQLAGSELQSSAKPASR